MKVRELIAALSEEDPDFEVCSLMADETSQDGYIVAPLEEFMVDAFQRQIHL